MEHIIRPHLEAGDYIKAQQSLKAHLQRVPQPCAQTLAEAGYWSCQANDFDTAVTLYRRACSLVPEHATYHYNLATTLRVCGDIKGAIQALHRHLELCPDDAEALWLLAQLRSTHTEPHAQAQLALLLKQELPPKQQVHAWYALGKIYEDQQQYAAGFDAITQGANLRRRYLRYQPSQDRAIFEQVQASFSQTWFANTPQGNAGAGNVFIVGMPRSGTTLVENLLGADANVALGGELNTFATCLMQQLKQTSTPANTDIISAIKHSAQTDFSQLGRAYQHANRDYQQSAALLTDKLPLNFLYLGLIHKALPQARIIRLQRHPLDTIWSIYKHLFTHAYPFSYDLGEITEYFIGYSRLMAHWQRLLGDNLLTLNYESLVENSRTEARRLYQFCALDFDPACLNFYQHARNVTTGSAVQVRQPIHARSVGQWQHYQGQLTGVKQRLIEAGLLGE